MPLKLQYLQCFLEFDPHKGVQLIDLADNMMHFSYYLGVYWNEITTKGGPTCRPHEQDINFIFYFSRYIICRGDLGG